MAWKPISFLPFDRSLCQIWWFDVKFGALVAKRLCGTANKSTFILTFTYFSNGVRYVWSKQFRYLGPHPLGWVSGQLSKTSPPCNCAKFGRREVETVWTYVGFQNVNFARPSTGWPAQSNRFQVGRKSTDPDNLIQICLNLFHLRWTQMNQQANSSELPSCLLKVKTVDPN